MGASCEGGKNRWDRSEGSGKQKRSEGKEVNKVLRSVMKSDKDYKEEETKKQNCVYLVPF